jgi:hypothetical protein
MRDSLVAILSTMTLLLGLGWYSAVHAQNHEMERHEPHMSAALGHLQQAKDELERATPNKGGHREKALQFVDQAIQKCSKARSITKSTTDARSQYSTLTKHKPLAGAVAPAAARSFAAMIRVTSSGFSVPFPASKKVPTKLRTM